MKCTTKIVLGIIGFVFAFSVIGIIYIAITFDREALRSWRYNDYSARSFEIPQEDMKSFDLSSFKVLSFKVDENAPVDGDKRVEGNIVLAPAKSKGDKNQLTFTNNISPYVNYEIVGDTLNIRLKHGDICKAYADSIGDWGSYVRGVTLTLSINNPEIQIISEIPRFGVIANDIDVNKLSVVANECSIVIQESKIGELSASIYREGGSGSVFLAKNTINTFNLDLDNVNNWGVKECQIGTENLTGSGNHNTQQSKSEAKIVNWIPKHKDAIMNVSLRGDTTQIKFQ